LVPICADGSGLAGYAVSEAIYFQLPQRLALHGMKEVIGPIPIRSTNSFTIAPMGIPPSLAKRFVDWVQLEIFPIQKIFFAREKPLGHSSHPSSP
jgi:hypothetical protein